MTQPEIRPRDNRPKSDRPTAVSCRRGNKVYPTCQSVSCVGAGASA